jgi:hypothetical protein
LKVDLSVLNFKCSGIFIGAGYKYLGRTANVKYDKDIDINIHANITSKKLENEVSYSRQ